MLKIVPNYKLIRYLNIIARISLQEEDLYSSDPSSKDPTKDKKEDLESVLGFIPSLP
ncbi:hypothetical protein EIK77_000072 [Talaromyces pinophilus]|nr:hypothetical protein EIK77_000072 [Talaromyces pinophilus]